VRIYESGLTHRRTVLGNELAIPYSSIHALSKRETIRDEGKAEMRFREKGGRTLHVVFDGNRQLGEVVSLINADGRGDHIVRDHSLFSESDERAIARGEITSAAAAVGRLMVLLIIIGSLGAVGYEIATYPVSLFLTLFFSGPDRWPVENSLTYFIFWYIYGPLPDLALLFLIVGLWYKNRGKKTADGHMVPSTWRELLQRIWDLMQSNGGS
jgi:hypothetical protein